MFFFLSLSLFLFTSSKDGRAGAANWGNTGAPGDQLTTSGQPRVCQSCHNSSAIQLNQTFEMTDAQGNPFDGSYTPGATYTVTVTNNVTVGNAARHGFQILCLTGGEGVEGVEVSNWTAVSDNVQIATASNTGRTYAEHWEPSISNEFEMEWIAPVEGTGEVTFYYVGAGVNNNNQTAGDGGTTNTITVSEGIESSTKDLTLDANVSIFPNPVGGSLNLETEVEEAGKYQVRIVDVLGKVLTNQSIDLASGSQLTILPTNHLVTGAYTIQLIKDGKFASQQILKK